MTRQAERLDALAVEAHHGLDAVNRAVLHAGLGDGLPVVPPTPERLAALLAGYDPLASAGEVPPSRDAATLRRLALCAVLAGCGPSQFPLLVAAAGALADPALNLLGVATTTGNAALGLLVHGPAVTYAALNAGANALGPGTAANATLGRALALVLRNVGGAVPGRTDMATQGQPAKFTCCAAENAAASPWGPLHATRGLKAGDPAVTVFAHAGVQELVDTASATGAGVLTTLAQSLLAPGVGVHVLDGGPVLGGGQPLLLLAPEHAALIALTHGRAEAQAALHVQARLPLERLAPDVRAHLLGGLPAGTPPPVALPVAERPEDILLAVVGGVGRKSTYLPAWGGGTRAVTRPVALR